MKTTKTNKKGKTEKKVEPKFRTMQDIQAGDYMVSDSYRYKIIGRLNDVIFFSENNGETFGNTSSLTKYINAGYTIESADTKEVTMSDICKKFGYNVKIKK